ncbi:MAG: sodium/substrate symporter small subunit [Bacteroidota bacterium]
METNSDYNFSLFKPNSDYSRRVRNIIISMLIIWAVAVFGFQILLRVIQKPTPEKAYITYNLVWEKVKTGNATATEKNDFVSSITAVLGKSSLNKDKREILANALSWSTYSSIDSSTKAVLLKNVQDFKSGRESLAESTNDQGYMQAKGILDRSKKEILSQVKAIYGYSPSSLEATIIAFNLTVNDVPQLSENDITLIPETMKLYLVHNQSFLTDFRFLGFPFHYFYTAEFLLILFVLLCLLYSMRIEKLQKRFNIVE